MLSRLQITNYALIDAVDIRLHPGFNVITGETGAGKSIMLGALALILGGRADTRAVRHHDAKSVIEATFRVEGNSALKEFFESNDIDWYPDGAILRREITPSGRSRAFINDTPVTLVQLREAAIHLIDIHSQHQNLLLADSAFQLLVIDRLARNEERLKEYSTKYKLLRSAVRKLKAARENLKKAKADEEYTRYQLDQLEQATLIAGEQEELEQRRELLANLTDVKSRLQRASESLDGEESSASDFLTDASSAIAPIAANIPGGDELVDRLESLSIEIRDIAETIESLNADLEADPYELENLEDRINTIYSLQSRFHAESVEELIAIRDNLQSKLELIDGADEDIASLEKEARRALAKVKEAAALISDARKEAARELAQKLRDTASPLGMKNLQVDIQVNPAEISASGADKVEFLFAFNKNQPLMPVAETASGGEISRLMLSLKSIIASHVSLPAIIFDEIDTGVSGDVATRMGTMMEQIGSHLQVIAITHLPQVAARGSSHFKVYKEDDEHATHTRISELDPEQRIDELSLMLSGTPDNDAARSAAISLIGDKK